MTAEYIKIGKCIWCQNEKPLVSFLNQPHTISKMIGGTYIGFDICDSCNSYFGKTDKSMKYPMSVELAFKEIFNVTRHLFLDLSEKQKGNNQILRSIYFEYYKSHKTFVIKKKFELKLNFIKDFTRQFKKGVYEVFLQEFHRNTGLGLDSKFDRIRKFVRYDKGDLPIYFADNNGIYLVPVDVDIPILAFGEHNISPINDFGFYSIYLFGHILYLEVTPRAELTREIYLKNEAKHIVGSGFINKSIREMIYITDLDFTLQKLLKLRTKQ